MHEITFAYDQFCSSSLGRKKGFVDDDILHVASTNLKVQLLQKLRSKETVVHSFVTKVFTLYDVCNVEAIFRYIANRLNCKLVGVPNADAELNMETGSSLSNVYIATLLKRCGHKFSDYRSDVFFSFFCVLSLSLNYKYILINVNDSCILPKVLFEVKKELKSVSTLCKALSQVVTPFAQLVGLDLCTGLSELPPLDEIKAYVARWLTNDGLNISRGKYIDTVILNTHFFRGGISVKDFISNLDSYLTGGSLVFSRSSKYRNMATSRAEAKGYIIESKHALPALFSESELFDMFMNTDAHDISVVSAADYNKPRFIASADIVSYMRMKYIELNIRVKPTFEFDNTHVQLTQFVDTEDILADNALDLYKFKLPLDYAVFDSQPMQSEVKNCILTIGNMVDTDITARLWSSILNGKVYYQSEMLGFYKHGIPSGWLWTNRLDSIANAAWILEAIQIYRERNNCHSKVWFRVNGDDVDARSNDKDLLLALPDILADMQLNVHKDKTSFRIANTEYLRTLCGTVTEYGARAINSVIDVNKKNVVELNASLMGDRAACFERLSKWTSIVTRFKNEAVIKYAIQEAVAWLRYRGNSVDAAMSYLATPTCRGGIGLTAVSLDNIIQCKVVLDEPKMHLGGKDSLLDRAVQKGGLRLKGSIRVEMVKVNKVFTYGRLGPRKVLDKLLPIGLDLAFIESTKQLVLNRLLKVVYNVKTILDKIDVTTRAGLLHAKELLIQSGLPRYKWRHILASGPDKSVFGLDLTYGKKWMSCLTKKYQDSKRDYFIKPGIRGWQVDMVI